MWRCRDLFPAERSSVSLFAAPAVIYNSSVLLTIPWERREPKLPGKCPVPCLQHCQRGSSALSRCMAASPLLYRMNCKEEAAFNCRAVTGQFSSPASRDISLHGSGRGRLPAAAQLPLGLRLPGCIVIPARLPRSAQGCGGRAGDAPAGLSAGELRAGPGGRPGVAQGPQGQRPAGPNMVQLRRRSATAAPP